jgi:hypothetical protein
MINDRQKVEQVCQKIMTLFLSIGNWLRVGNISKIPQQDKEITFSTFL